MVTLAYGITIDYVSSNILLRANSSAECQLLNQSAAIQQYSGANPTNKALMMQSGEPGSDSNSLAFLLGGGEMGSLIRSMDWSETSLGPVAEWPQSLRTTISICLASNLPICVIWGAGLVQLYNDAYRLIIGNKHPRSMGQNFSECFKDAWPVIGAAHDSAMSGNPAFLESQQIFLERHGYVEETFFTFSFSPIRDEAGQIGGLFHPVVEMTGQMLSERRTRALRDLTAQTSKAKSVSEALSLSAQTLAEYDLDLPFVMLYSLDADGDQAQVVGATGLKADCVFSPSAVGLGLNEQTPWPLQEVARTGLATLVDDVRQRIGITDLGPYPEPPNEALVLPIILPGASRPTAIFIAGVSSRLRLNEAYRSFYDLLASAVTAAVTNARAYDDERRRAKALADLDRAKIAFFSNVSHEFRTPLTLMLGPVEDALAASEESLPPLQRERLELVHRNGLRLQRLVNSLLDFSRIEAGRVRAVYEPTDLSDFTADLASNFRSACDKASLGLRVHCPPLGEPIFVDRSMWETILLNLLSNAFKFTFEGDITVSLEQSDRAVELRVRDTGIGVAAKEIPLLFERFHQVENAHGRTHEGSGIGLALVRELVKLHGGAISVDSELGRGTTFIISIPLGSQHLPQEQVGTGGTAAQPTAGVSSFVEEALRWLPDVAPYPALGAAVPSPVDDLTGRTPLTQGADDRRPFVLIADDNADMRQYLVRLLSPLYRIEAVSNGETALAAVRGRIPDLVLTDVMMPRLDGFGLLQALRADLHTSGLPVIMLSARAGEESRIEGMQKGADDYLVKPFSAGELLARVAAHLQMAQMRREAGEALRASGEQFRALVSASSDVVYRMNADWTELRQLEGREFIADTHEPNRSWLEKYILPDDQPRLMAATRDAVLTKSVFQMEHQVVRVDGTLGWAFSRAIPLFDKDGTIVEWLGMASDVTARKEAQEAQRQSEQKYYTLFESMDEGYCVIEMIFDADARPVDYRFLETNPAFDKHTGLRNAQGKRMRELAPDHDAYWFEIYGQVAVTGEAIRFVNEAKALEGRWFDVYAFRLGDEASRKVAILFNDVSERRASDEAVRESEARIRAFANAAPAMLWETDQTGQCTFLSCEWYSFTGQTEAEALGLGWTDATHPDDQAKANRTFLAANADREEFRLEYRLRTGGGGYRWALDVGRPRFAATGEYLGMVGVVIDIDDRKRAEERLQASEEQRRLALDAAELGTWHVKPGTRATQTDERYRAIFSTTEEWTDYLQAVAVIHPDDQAAVLEAVAAATRLDDPVPYAIEYRIIHPDGSLRWISAKGRPSYEGNGAARRVTSFDGTVADITERKQGEEERERLVSQLQEQDQRKDEFLATLAHELRNPLAPIRNGLEIMHLAQGDANTIEHVRSMMERQLSQMVHLIDDLLDLSRINHDKIELRKERIELASAVQQAVEVSRPSIVQSGHELLIKFPPVPIYVDADQTRLVQVFSNLLNNATKFTESGGRLRLTVQLLGTEAVISIQDNGIGIPAQILPHVFEMFRQADINLERSHGGLGIGLYIVKRLVEMHGGAIDARSEGPGRGSEFVVRLPVALSFAEEAPNHQPDPISTPACHRIMVVDDNLDAAESLAMLLTMMGNETLLAHDGLAALDLAETFRPDVMFLDIGMPKLNGFEVGRRIRQQAWGKDMVLIAVTGWGQEEDKRRSTEAGLDFHLTKPILPSAVEELLADLRIEETTCG